MESNALRLLEFFGASTALLYLVLITKRRRSAWVWYVVSSAAYVPVFWSQQLFAVSALQLFFIGMGVWGWFSWDADDAFVRIARWRGMTHLWLVLAIAGLTYLFGLMLGSMTEAGWYVYPDAFILAGSVAATFLTIMRVLENWWYWLVVNISSCCLYGVKGIWITFGLATVYALLSIRGLAEWRRASSSDCGE